MEKMMNSCMSLGALYNVTYGNLHFSSTIELLIDLFLYSTD